VKVEQRTFQKRQTVISVAKSCLMFEQVDIMPNILSHNSAGSMYDRESASGSCTLGLHTVAADGGTSDLCVGSTDFFFSPAKIGRFIRYRVAFGFGCASVIVARGCAGGPNAKSNDAEGSDIDAI
jgi:hypothetical protein